MKRMIRVVPVLGVIVLFLVVMSSVSEATPTFFGPTPYLSAGDIPAGFYAGGPTFLEDFEDGSLGGGITASVGAVIPPGWPGLIDSVDGDDGTIDGSGLAGHSWFSINGQTGVTFTFSVTLPTAAGIVWTDGDGTTTFEAFGPGMVSLGTIGPVAIATPGSYGGQTNSDRFFGVQNLGGILAVKLSNSSGGLEVDHVQYGSASVPEPATMFLLGLGLVGLAGLKRRIS